MNDKDLQMHEVHKKDPNLSPKEEEERKQRVLTHGVPSITNSIADAIVIKDGNMFFLSNPDGDVPMGGDHGYGLYYNDCRYLNGYVMKLANSSPSSLVSNAARGTIAVFEMTNPEVKIDTGLHIPRDVIGVTWDRIIDDETNTLYDQLTFKNYSQDEYSFPVSFDLNADFDDIFDIRGLLSEHPGKLQAPAWQGEDTLVFGYAGADGIYRQLSIQFSPKPASQENTSARYNLKLKSRET